MYAFEAGWHVGKIYSTQFDHTHLAHEAFIRGELPCTNGAELHTLRARLAAELTWDILAEVDSVFAITASGAKLPLGYEVFTVDDTALPQGDYLNLPSGTLRPKSDEGTQLSGARYAEIIGPFAGIPVFVQIDEADSELWEVLLYDIEPSQIKHAIRRHAKVLKMEHDLKEFDSYQLQRHFDALDASEELALQASAEGVQRKSMRYAKRDLEKKVAKKIVEHFDSGQQVRKDDAKILFASNLGTRSFLRAWEIATVSRPELSKPRKRPKGQ
ncbi:hypothetical protein [Sulfitobacter sp. PS-8MA]|uniref:hypothetical protein n=1 Tax=Sulfitobacter sp. PS-8MA TaxID=3237707 RepID=UPI0034C67D45